ncbi:hypothetical protein ACEPAI_8181 [Sanghuangporus weigelae]
MPSGWNEEDWIGQGLKYEICAKFPAVKAQRDILLHIPDIFNQARPLPSLSVKTLLCRMECITQGEAYCPTAAEELFSKEGPNTDLGQLFSAPILPPINTLEEMWKSFGQLWLEGGKSIMDFSHPETQYPFNVLIIFCKLALAAVFCKDWYCAEEWMAHGKRAPGITEAEALAH